MSFLPTIGTRQLTSRTDSSEVRATNSNQTIVKRTGQKNMSLLELSQNMPSVYHDYDKHARSRSHDPAWSGDESENQKKKARLDRSKSLGRGDQRKGVILRPIDKNANYILTNRNADKSSQKVLRRLGTEKRVRFDSSSEESYGNVKRTKTRTSDSKPTGVQYKIGAEKGGENSLRSPQDVRNKDSPTEVRRRPAPGTHQARLEAARTKAKVWSETYSDPGPIDKSIDNDKVIRGQPVDPRRGRLQAETPRGKHAQYISQKQQDERPKAADNTRRLQSLPAKKEAHDYQSKVTETEDRSVISAPSKEQGQLEVPLPKINTLVPKDSHDSKSSAPQPSTSTGETSAPQQSNSTGKTTEPQPSRSKLSDAKIETTTPHALKAEASKRRSEAKGETSETLKDYRHQQPVSMEPQTKQEQKQTADMIKKPEPAKHTQEPRHTEEKKKALLRQTEAKQAGVAGKSGQEDDRKREGRLRLPADDHGPVVRPPETKPPNEQPLTDESKFKYYASEKERMAKLQEKQAAEKKLNDTAQEQSEKSWTTIKTKTTETKPSILSPRKSQTTYGFSSNKDNAESKRREVTIVDPKSMKKIEGGDDEPFMHEYEYHHSNEMRHKNFNDMTDEEKVEYFRDKLHMKPEQIRELTFHPKVTEPKEIHHTYTGIDTGNWSAKRVKSGRKSRSNSIYRRVSVVPPAQRKSVMLSKLQGVVYRKINQVYGSSPRDVREKQFFEKLAQFQLDDMQRRYEMLAEKERRALEAKFRQREQLKRVRKKFEDDAWRRFMTQYVTSKVIEAETRNREEYGLPNEVGRVRHSIPGASRMHAKRARYAMTPKRMHRRNEKKYANIFRFNTGPIPKSGGKPPKFEGFDTVYLDTEDENETVTDTGRTGKPVKKKQSVDALMREAKRILDQSDEDIDLGETPRKSQSERPRHRYDRPHRHRTRRHVPDDKSHKSTVTSRSKASRSEPPPPKTMKELIARRQSYAAPTVRYQASNFNAIKADLIKGSDLLNKNEKLKGTVKQAEQEREDKRETEKPSQPKPVSVRDNMKTPPASPVPPRDDITTKTSVVTKTTTVVEKKTTVSDNGETVTNGKGGYSYLDNMETQIGIDTARAKAHEEEKKKQIRAPSRVSSKIERTVHDVSRTASRISFRAQQEQKSSQDVKPPRAPSRTSVAPTPKPSGRYSRASVVPMNEPGRSDSRATRTKTESVFLTETEPEIPTSMLIQKTSSGSHVSIKQNIKTQGSTTTLQRADKHTSENPSPQSNIQKTSIKASATSLQRDDQNIATNPSTQPKVQTNGRRTSIVDITSTSGRVSPSVEKEPTTRRESTTETKQVHVSRRNSSLEPQNRRESVVSRYESISRRGSDRVSVKEAKSPPRISDARNMNGEVDTQKQKKTVSTSVTVSENVIETTNTSSKVTKHPRHSIIGESRKSVDHSNDDLLSTKKAAYHARKEESLANKEKPKPRERPKHKTNRRKSEQSPARKRSRSRTPRRESIVNGYPPTEDIKMEMSKYEEMRNEGRQARRRSESVGKGSKERKRSTSRGRKASLSKGRKRSTSNERRRSKGGKSRFPDIRKKDGKWEITARSPTQAVSRKESIEETVTERVITPKPGGANQWKDLVEKYLRQPSPKVGKTEDRSLLDANLETDDDDDEMDIFKRAQMKYKLTVETDEDDSDAE